MSSNDDGRICVAQEDANWALRLEGDLRADKGAGLLQWIHGVMDQLNNDSRVVVDFAAVRLIDSTILGHLARLAVMMADASGERPIFVHASDDIRHLLVNMGFEHIAVLEQSDDSQLPHSFRAVDDVEETRDQGLQRVLAAHELLASLSENNREAFKDVIDHLRNSRSMADS